MKKSNRADTIFRIFSAVCSVLSVYVFALLRRLTGDPATKMLTDILIILLLVVLNTAVLVLYAKLKEKKE